MGIGRKRISFEGSEFFYLRLATGGGFGGVGGSYPVIESYVRPMPRLIIGNELSGKYTLGKFLILPPHEFVQIGQQKLLLGSDDLNFRQRIKTYLEQNPELCNFLFQKKFSHVTFSTRIEVGGWSVFRKKYVMCYYGLPENESKEVPDLNEHLKKLSVLVKQSGECR